MTLSLSVTLFAALAPAVYGLEGNEHSGGGDSVICFYGRPGEIPNAYPRMPREVILADLFPVSESQPKLYRRIQRLAPDSILRASIDYFQSKYPNFSKTLSAIAFKPVGAIWETQFPPLRELDDDHIQLKRIECRKRQLAIQNLDTQNVEVEMDLLIRLSHAEKALLKVHEALLKVSGIVGDTTPVRQEIAKMVQSREFHQLIASYKTRYIPTDEQKTEILSPYFYVYYSMLNKVAINPEELRRSSFREFAQKLLDTWPDKAPLAGTPYFNSLLEIVNGLGLWISELDYYQIVQDTVIRHRTLGEFLQTLGAASVYERSFDSLEERDAHFKPGKTF